MSDFSFMRSGFNMTDNSSEQTKLQFIQMCGSIMRVLSEEACKSAAMRAQACGRNDIVGIDMVLALKYEAHEFFQKDIETRFLECLREEQTGESWIAQFLPQDNYETEEENDDENATEGDTESTQSNYESSDDEESTGHSLVETATDSQRELYEKMKKYDEEWNDWNPEDPAQQLIKKSIDSIDERMRID